MTPKSTVYLAVFWLATVAIAYFAGWYSGVSGAVHVAAGAASSGMSFVLILLFIVAAASGIAAYRARGYFSHKT